MGGGVVHYHVTTHLNVTCFDKLVVSGCDVEVFLGGGGDCVYVTVHSVISYACQTNQIS